MGPRRRLALLLASVRDAGRRTAKSAVCSAGECMSLLSSHGPWSGSGCTMPPHNSACCMAQLKQTWHMRRRSSGRMPGGGQVSQHSFDRPLQSIAPQCTPCQLSTATAATARLCLRRSSTPH